MGFIDMENNVQIHAIRDDLGLLQTYNLELYIIKWNSFKVASKTSIPVQVVSFNILVKIITNHEKNVRKKL